MNELLFSGVFTWRGMQLHGTLSRVLFLDKNSSPWFHLNMTCPNGFIRLRAMIPCEALHERRLFTAFSEIGEGLEVISRLLALTGRSVAYRVI